MSTTPNYNLTVYPADDITTKFYNYRTATSGDTASSNFMIIDTALKGLQDGIDALESKPGLVQVVGTGTNSYTATVSDFTYITGQSIILSVSTANTGASTLDINSLGVRPLMKYNTAGTMVQLDAGDLRANNLYLFTNRNNNWILVGVSGANNINVSGNSGDILTVSDDNTIESSDLKVDEIARSVNRSFTAGASMAQSVICGLNEDNLWVPLRSNYSFPIGTMVGITDSTTTLNAEAPITITGYTPFLSTGLTLNPSPLQTDAVVFMKGSINDSGDFVPADTLTNILEPSASYLEIGYIVNNYNMILSEKHTVYTLDADGNISSIDNIPIGGAGSSGQTVQTFSIGDGSTTVFTLNHGGNTQYVQLLVRTTATPHTYLVPDWAVVDNNNIQLTFDTAPSANEYQAIVYVLEPKVSNAFYKQTIGDGTNTEYYIHHNLGIEAPTVKLKQLSDNSYVYSGIFMEDENGDASQNVIKLTFYQPIPANSIDVYVESGNVSTIVGTSSAPQMAVFGITDNASYSSANEYQKLILNSVLTNTISGCSLNTSTGDITLPAGTYIVSGSVGFAGSTTEQTVSVYVKNPYYNNYVRQTANIGYSNDPVRVAKTVSITTMFTVSDVATIDMGCRNSVTTSVSAADYYTHIEIMKIG